MLASGVLHSLKLTAHEAHFVRNGKIDQKHRIFCVTAAKYLIFVTLYTTHTHRDHTELVIGDDNLVMLTITALNRGEGAYETELYTLIPPEADYFGVERRVEVNTHFTLTTKRFILNQSLWLCIKGYI